MTISIHNNIIEVDGVFFAEIKNPERCCGHRAFFRYNNTAHVLPSMDAKDIIRAVTDIVKSNEKGTWNESKTAAGEILSGISEEIKQTYGS